MYFARKKGFTLVELLVVISILGILAAALTTQVTRARALGQTVRCKANMKNLAQAVSSYSVDEGGNRLPHAGSFEHVWPRTDANGVYMPFYHERKGWISWYKGGPWISRTSVAGTDVQFYEEDEAKAYYATTNGALWGYVGKEASSYVCDVHKTVAKRFNIKKVRWSYAMNGYFGFNYKTGGRDYAVLREIFLESLSSRGNADSLLLFAELPAYKLTGGSFKESISKDAKASDAVLETRIKGYANNVSEETIGFNHQVGKRFAAHLAFADGHVGVVVAPKSASDSKLKDLTFLLCNGVDIPADDGEWKNQRDEYLSN